MRYIPFQVFFGDNVNNNLSVYRKKTRARVQNRPCRTVGAKIACVLGFLVYDIEFVEFDRNVFLVNCLFKEPIKYGEDEHCRTHTSRWNDSCRHFHTRFIFFFFMMSLKYERIFSYQSHAHTTLNDVPLIRTNL